MRCGVVMIADTQSFSVCLRLALDKTQNESKFKRWPGASPLRVAAPATRRTTDGSQ